MRKENPADYCAPKEGNVSYHLWKRGRMNILIRTRDDGVVIDGNQQVIFILFYFFCICFVLLFFVLYWFWFCHCLFDWSLWCVFYGGLLILALLLLLSV